MTGRWGDNVVGGFLCPGCGTDYVTADLAADCAGTHRDDEADDSDWYEAQDLED